MTEDKMARWHHRLNGHQFEQTLGDGQGAGSLVCCSPCSRKELDIIELLNNNSNKVTLIGSRDWDMDIFQEAIMPPATAIIQEEMLK